MKKFFCLFVLSLLLVQSGAEAAKKKKKEETPDSSAVSNAKYDDIALFGRVINFIEKQYVDEVKTKDLVYGAIKGMLETLDPHSNFMPPEIYTQLKTDTAGKFGGLGIEVWVNKDNILTVVSPMEGTPAWKAGIKPGDRIMKIDGVSTKGMSIVEATTKIRGEIGTDIQFTIARDGELKPLEFKLRRVSIDLKSVKHELLADDFGYIRLSHFQEHSATEMKEAIKAMETKHKLNGLILDMRNNPGGLLDQAVDVSNLFIDGGPIVSTIGRNKDDKEVKFAKSGIARLDFPMIVLVNGNSASAAEIVAGALKDHKRALIVGSRTFGKGSVQTVIPLADDVGLKLTIARYYTPNGTSIQAKGIEPDIQLEDMDQDTFQKLRKKHKQISEADLKNHFNNEGEGAVEQAASDTEENDNVEDLVDTRRAEKAGKVKFEVPKALDPKEDYQVQQALNYLRAMDFRKGSVAEVTAPETKAK